MADDKKKAGGGESGLFHKDHHKEVLYVVLPALIVIGAILQRFFAWWDNLNFFAEQSPFERLLIWLYSWWPTFRLVSAVLSVVAIAWGLYAYFKLRQIEHEEEKIYGHDDVDALIAVSAKPENDRWEKILAHSHSNNPAEWHLAIMDADVLMDETLRARGYGGEGLAEILKSIEPTDMLTLDAAWDAHKVRNRVAHDGPAFELTERETRRVISLYEAVFKELGVI